MRSSRIRRTSPRPSAPSSFAAVAVFGVSSGSLSTSRTSSSAIRAASFDLLKEADEAAQRQPRKQIRGGNADPCRGRGKPAFGIDTVTVSGHPGKDLHPFVHRSILKQAGLRK